MIKRIFTLIDKEWAEVFKRRMVLFTIIFMPVLFTVMPLLALHFSLPTSGIPADTTDMPARFAQACQSSLSPLECVQFFLASQFLLLYLFIPMMIPITIAAYSIVGEKTNHSLEPLLAAPISTAELLLGKGLSAVIPAVTATWISFGIFALLLPWVGISPALRLQLLGPTWLAAIFLIGPLMAVAAVSLTMIVSSRVTDPRTAEQLSAVLVIPVLAVLFAQVAGVMVVNLATVIVSIQTLLVVDAALISIGTHLFQRETILTKWK